MNGTEGNYKMMLYRQRNNEYKTNEFKRIDSEKQKINLISCI